VVLVWVAVEGRVGLVLVVAELVVMVVGVTLENQPGTFELGFEEASPPSSLFSLCDEAASGRESADPISVRVCERARTSIEGATAATWPVGERFLLFSARRSSTIVLSSRISFSTSESSSVLANELFDWFERLRCRRGVFRDERWSTSIEWLDELLRSRECCGRGVDGTFAFAGNSLTAGEGVWVCVVVSVGDALFARVPVRCLSHL
jgi:hypothetical protein